MNAQHDRNNRARKIGAKITIAQGLDSELYGQLKAQYSELCADYFDELHNAERLRSQRSG